MEKGWKLIDFAGRKGFPLRTMHTTNNNTISKINVTQWEEYSDKFIVNWYQRYMVMTLDPNQLDFFFKFHRICDLYSFQHVLIYFVSFSWNILIQLIDWLIGLNFYLNWITFIDAFIYNLLLTNNAFCETSSGVICRYLWLVNELIALPFLFRRLQVSCVFRPIFESLCSGNKIKNL